ncbi:acyl-CoA N-acyltransferase [Mycena sp. CBHHK59/15]|nr:acyl-CoA N-acyltransferase [Mycena sp. CBHHK59/15]
MADISTGSAEVKRANKATASQISRMIPNSTTHNFKVVFAPNLDEDARNSLWDMFEANMRPMYTRSSFGWDPPHKKGELFDPLSRFILVYPNGDEGSLIAFTAFRFEFEEDESILYCYDLQVSPAVQRQGLGRALMDHLAKIGAHFCLDKIMLTVFKVNKGALKFYKAFG